MNVHKNAFCRMARIAAAVLALPVIAGCSAVPRDPLAYQSEVSSYEIEEDGRIWCVTPEADGFSAELTAPASVAGITICLCGGEASAASGSTVLPLSGGMRRAAENLFACLTLNGEEITDRKSDPAAGCILLTFTDGTAAAVSDTGQPLWFERSGKRYTVLSVSRE